MSNKKSYMDRYNLLGEGFFNKLFKLFKIKDDDVKDKIKKDPKVKKALNKLNTNQKEFEDYLSKLSGEEIKLSRFDADDFLKR